MPRPARTANPTTKLKDTANPEAQLSFQRKAVQDFHSRQADQNDAPASSTLDANRHAPSSVNVGLAPQNKRSNSSINNNDTEDEMVDQLVPRMFCLCPTITCSSASMFVTAKKKRATATTSQAKSKHATSATVETVDDVDMTGAEENVRAKGMVFPITKGHPRKLKHLFR